MSIVTAKRTIENIETTTKIEVKVKELSAFKLQLPTTEIYTNCMLPIMIKGVDEELKVSQAGDKIPWSKLPFPYMLTNLS